MNPEEIKPISSSVPYTSSIINLEEFKSLVYNLEDINKVQEANRDFIVYTGEKGRRLFSLELQMLVTDKPKEVKDLARELIDSGDTDNLIMAEYIL